MDIKMGENWNLRAPSFGVNNNWVLIDSLFHGLLEPRAERRSHGLNREGPTVSSAIDAQAC